MKNILKQALHFFIYSGIGWLMDMILFAILNHIGLSTFISNIISSSCAATYVFFISGKNLFKKHGKVDMRIKYIVYIIYQLILILIASWAISGISVLLLNYASIIFIKKYYKLIAKILFTPVTMILNFIVAKNLIEKL